MREDEHRPVAAGVLVAQPLSVHLGEAHRRPIVISRRPSSRVQLTPYGWCQPHAPDHDRPRRPVGLSEQLQDALRVLIARGGLPAGTLLPARPTARPRARGLAQRRARRLRAAASRRPAHRSEGGGHARRRSRSPVRPVARAPPSTVDLLPDVTDLSAFPVWLGGERSTGAARASGRGAGLRLGPWHPRAASSARRLPGPHPGDRGRRRVDRRVRGLMAAVGLLREALVLRRIAVPRIGYPVLAGACGDRGRRRRGSTSTSGASGSSGSRAARNAPPSSSRRTTTRSVSRCPRSAPRRCWPGHTGEAGSSSKTTRTPRRSTTGPAPARCRPPRPSARSSWGRSAGTLAPGLRLGWIVAAAGARAPARRHRARTDPGPPVIDQMAFARLSRRRGRSIATCGACAARAAAARKR